MRLINRVSLSDPSASIYTTGTFGIVGGAISMFAHICEQTLK